MSLALTHLSRVLSSPTWFTPTPRALPAPLALTFINTDSLSFSRLTILMATFWHVTQ